jgi:cyclic pyranopterin phosphate synthase
MENGFYDLNNFWDKAEKEFFPYIKEIELLSGEPFIQKDTYKLIEKIVPINPDCQWAFTTNAHWKLNSRIKQDLDRIIIKNIIISVDSMNKERFESIRKNGSFDFLLENIFNLKKYSEERVAAGRSDLGLTIHFTAMRENFLDALDILNFCEAHGIRHSFKTLLVPDELSVLTLPYDEQKKILNSFIDRAGAMHLKRGIRVIRPLLEKMNPVDRASMYDNMFEKMKSG